MVWGEDRCGAACVRGQLYFRRMRVIRTEKMLIENADMIVCETIHSAQPEVLRCQGAGGRPRRAGEGRPRRRSKKIVFGRRCLRGRPPGAATMRAALSDELYLAVPFSSHV